MTATTKAEVPSIGRGPFYGAVALVLVTLATVAGGRLIGLTATEFEPSAVVQTQDLRFQDRTDRGVGVLDAQTGREIAVLSAGTNGFLRATLRGLAQQRRREGLDDTPPFRLTRFADGRLWLEDPATGRKVPLEAFGQTNAAVFAGFLTTAEAKP